MSSRSKSASKIASAPADVLNELKNTAKNIVGDLSDTNQVVMWVVRIALVLLAAVVVPLLPENTLDFIDNTIVRVVLVVLIVLLALYDPASAIIMAVAFLVGIQTLNRLRMSNMANSAVVSGPPLPEIHERPVDVVHSESKREGGAVVSEGYFDYASVPQQVLSGETSLDSGCFTSPQQFRDAQSNEVSDNQNTEVRTWTNELGPQGLSGVAGYNAPRHGDLLSVAYPLL